MGNCLSIRYTRQHESLNENDDGYFDRIQSRNTIGSSSCEKIQQQQQQQHPKEQHGEDTTFLESMGRRRNLHNNVEPILTPSTTVSGIDSSLASSPGEWSFESQNESSSSPWKTSHIPTHFTFSSPSGAVSTESNSLDDSDPFSLRYPVKDAMNSWHLKRKGRALQLRLAKNRFLQLSVDPSSSPQSAASPVSIGSNKARQSQPSEDWDNEFEATGMIWAEITRQAPVSALAMSRTCLSLPATPRTLLMALGDESGRLTVMEVLGGHQPLSILDGGDRKFGEMVNIRMRGRIRCADFSPDDRHLLIGGDGCVAAIFDIVTDPTTLQLEDVRLLQTVERLDRIYSVQFDPTARHLTIAGFDGKIALYTTEGMLQGNPMEAEFSREGLLYCLHWHPNGSSFAVGGSDKRCGIYGRNGKLLREISRAGAIQSLKWNNDGSYLAIGSRGEVTVFDEATFSIKCELSNMPDESMRYRVQDLCWSPDGSFLAIAGSDGSCLVVETKTYALVHQVHRNSSILCLSWGQCNAANECYRYLAIADRDSCVALVKAGIKSDGSEIDESSSTASSAYFSTASETNWILHADSFRDMEDSPPEPASDLLQRGIVTAVAFSRTDSPKGSSYLAYATDDGALSLMTTRNWSVIFQMEFAKPLRALAFSHSNNILVFGGDEGVFSILSVPSRSIIFTTVIPTSISSVAFSCQDERLSIGSLDGVLTLLCPTSIDWEPVGEIDFSDSPILCHDWSIRTLAIGREDGSVTLFDKEKAFDNFFVPLAEFSHPKPVYSLTFGACGQYLAAVGGGGHASIRNIQEGWLLCHEFHYGQEVRLVAASWSPDGRYLAFSGTNDTFRMIDTVTWSEVVEVEIAVDKFLDNDSSVGGISSVDWSLDGAWIALGTLGRGIHTLRADSWQLLIPSNEKVRF